MPVAMTVPQMKGGTKQDWNEFELSGSKSLALVTARIAKMAAKVTERLGKVAKAAGRGKGKRPQKINRKKKERLLHGAVSR